MKLLHVDSSILGEASVSRAISASVVERLKATRPDIAVTTRDLAAAPISHLSGSYLAGQSADTKHDQAQQEDLALGGAALAEFIASDIVVLGTPMYNFTVPSQLKAWIDRILVAGKTFRYTEKGPEGLMNGKRVILALSRGGVYSAGAPHAALDNQEPYLRTVFGFMGVTDVEAVRAEGIALGAEQRARALEAAKRDAAALRAA